MRKKGKTIGAVTKNAISKKGRLAAKRSEMSMLQMRGVGPGTMGPLKERKTMMKAGKKMMGKKLQKWMPPTKLKRY